MTVIIWSEIGVTSATRSASRGTPRTVRRKTSESVKSFPGSFSTSGLVTMPIECVSTRSPFTILGTGMYQHQPSGNAKQPIGERFFSRKMFQSPSSPWAGRPPR
ncbi:hypothetical protein CcI156_18575 [Frankia sp. CcI156]|nr:hypothetical protein CcI156_18575 [Frankia sp. CcI156]